MTTYNTPEPITATLTTAGTRVRVAASERADTVVRVEPINSASKVDVKVAEHTTVDFADGVLSVKTTKSGDKAGSVAITVELPVGSQLVLNTAWTDVHADGPLGDCALNIASGHIQLDHTAALRANLAAGGLTVGHVAGTATIDGGAAGVRLGEVKGFVRYQGTTGKVWIGHAWGDVELGGSSGSFEVELAEGSVTAKAANCPIRVGRMARGHATLTNASGGIDIGISEGTSARVDADSTKGVVRNSLTGHDNVDSTVTVHARARLDDIVIHAV